MQEPRRRPRRSRQSQIDSTEMTLQMFALHDTFYLECRREWGESFINILVRNQNNRLEPFLKVDKLEIRGNPYQTLNFMKDDQRLFYAIKDSPLLERYYVCAEVQLDNLEVYMGEVRNFQVHQLNVKTANDLFFVDVYDDKGDVNERQYCIQPGTKYMRSLIRNPCSLKQLGIVGGNLHTPADKVGLITYCGDKTTVVKLGLGDSGHQLSTREKAVLLAASVRVFEKYFAPIQVCGYTIGNIGELGLAFILLCFGIISIIVSLILAGFYVSIN